MMGPSPADLARYAPRDPAGVVELNINDHWRAKWIADSELPEHAPVMTAYAMVFRGERAYVTREHGEDRWSIIEGDLGESESAEDFVVRAAFERTGAKVTKTELFGFFECKATSQNPQFPVGTITVQPFYIASASDVEDVPDESGYERRRLPLNEFNKLIRARYPQSDLYLQQGTQRYTVMLARGEV